MKSLEDEIKMKIVAVDDSGIILRVIEKALGEKYAVHGFISGMRALKFLRDREPDLIILDIDMPEIDGYEMLERIKKMEHLRDTPVIFLTSNGDKSHVVRAVAGGAKDYVVKPIDEDILLSKVDALLDNDRLGRA